MMVMKSDGTMMILPALYIYIYDVLVAHSVGLCVTHPSVECSVKC